MIRAFTIVELLIATALAAMLMAGVLRVTATIRVNPAGALDQGSRQNRWVERLVEQVAWDLANARSIEFNENEITMAGYGFRDRMNAKPDNDPPINTAHRPVSVRYELTGQAGQRWLLRLQTNLDELTNRNTWASLLCGGVERFELKPDVQLDPTGLMPMTQVMPGQPLPIPDRVLLVLSWVDNHKLADAQRHEIERWIVLR